MVKSIGPITLYSVKDLHDALGVNERTVREWFNRGRLKGVRISGEWHVTEENLRRFLNGEEAGTSKEPGRRRLSSLRKGKAAKEGSDERHEREHTEKG